MTVLAVLLTVATVIFATGGVIYGLSKRDECLRAWQKMAAARGLEYRRPSFWATAAVVPDPRKQSSTRSPGLLEILRIRSSKRGGFSVG